MTNNVIQQLLTDKDVIKWIDLLLKEKQKDRKEYIQNQLNHYIKYHFSFSNSKKILDNNERERLKKELINRIKYIIENINNERFEKEYKEKYGYAINKKVLKQILEDNIEPKNYLKLRTERINKDFRHFMNNEEFMKILLENRNSNQITINQNLIKSFNEIINEKNINKIIITIYPYDNDNGEDFKILLGHITKILSEILEFYYVNITPKKNLNKREIRDINNNLISKLATDYDFYTIKPEILNHILNHMGVNIESNSNSNTDDSTTQTNTPPNQEETRKEELRRAQEESIKAQDNQNRQTENEHKEQAHQQRIQEEHRSSEIQGEQLNIFQSIIIERKNEADTYKSSYIIKLKDIETEIISNLKTKREEETNARIHKINQELTPDKIKDYITQHHSDDEITIIFFSFDNQDGYDNFISQNNNNKITQDNPPYVGHKRIKVKELNEVHIKPRVDLLSKLNMTGENYLGISGKKFEDTEIKDIRWCKLEYNGDNSELLQTLISSNNGVQNQEGTGNTGNPSNVKNISDTVQESKKSEDTNSQETFQNQKISSPNTEVINKTNRDLKEDDIKNKFKEVSDEIKKLNNKNLTNDKLSKILSKLNELDNELTQTFNRLNIEKNMINEGIKKLKLFNPDSINNDLNNKIKNLDDKSKNIQDIIHNINQYKTNINKKKEEIDKRIISLMNNSQEISPDIKSQKQIKKTQNKIEKNITQLNDNLERISHFLVYLEKIKIMIETEKLTRWTSKDDIKIIINKFDKFKNSIKEEISSLKVTIKIINTELNQINDYINGNSKKEGIFNIISKQENTIKIISKLDNKIDERNITEFYFDFKNYYEINESIIKYNKTINETREIIIHKINLINKEINQNNQDNLNIIKSHIIGIIELRKAIGIEQNYLKKELEYYHNITEKIRMNEKHLIIMNILKSDYKIKLNRNNWLLELFTFGRR
jgi:hypothetical protein